jgi:regulator of replication initiation timing
MEVADLRAKLTQLVADNEGLRVTNHTLALQMQQTTQASFTHNFAVAADPSSVAVSDILGAKEIVTTTTRRR